MNPTRALGALALVLVVYTKSRTRLLLLVLFDDASISKLRTVRWQNDW
jgi:hypothetical protein